MGADRVELYTEPYAAACRESEAATRESFAGYAAAATLAHELGLGINAGHDLDLDNLVLFRTLPHLDEVSIGTDLVIDIRDAPCGGTPGFTTASGGVAHWPGGLCLCFPGKKTINGQNLISSRNLPSVTDDWQCAVNKHPCPARSRQPAGHGLHARAVA